VYELLVTLYRAPLIVIDKCNRRTPHNLATLR
jgi:hypothetical protein